MMGMVGSSEIKSGSSSSSSSSSSSNGSNSSSTNHGGSNHNHHGTISPTTVASNNGSTAATAMTNKDGDTATSTNYLALWDCDAGQLDAWVQSLPALFPPSGR